MAIGTPSYMSPEQISCGSVDIRSDIYGLGATLYHLLTGSVPFPGVSLATVVDHHLHAPVPDPGTLTPTLSPQTRYLVMRCLAKTPEQRFSTYQEVVHACDQALASLGGSRLQRTPRPACPPSAPTPVPDSQPGIAQHAVVIRPASKRIPAPASPEHAEPAKPAASPIQAVPAASTPQPAPQPPAMAPVSVRLPKLPPIAKQDPTTSIIFREELPTYRVGVGPRVLAGVGTAIMLIYLFA